MEPRCCFIVFAWCFCTLYLLPLAMNPERQRVAFQPHRDFLLNKYFDPYLSCSKVDCSIRLTGGTKKYSCQYISIITYFLRSMITHICTFHSQLDAKLLRCIMFSAVAPSCYLAQTLPLLMEIVISFLKLFKLNSIVIST